MADSPNKQAAIALASRGLRNFPCKADKTPMVAAWEDAANASVFQAIAKWEASPFALPGLPVGAQGFLVIDADRKPGGPDGVAAFHALCMEHGVDLADAFVVETPSGGWHFYFATETPYGNSSGSLPRGIDVRGNGGYVIAPGATLRDGRSYRIIHGSWDAIPALPEALAAFLREKHANPLPALAAASTVLPATEREQRFAEAALVDEVGKLSSMHEGEGRNAALNSAAHSLGTMSAWIDPHVVANALYEASITNGYVTKDGENAAKQTIMSGLIAGRSNPRPLLGLPSHMEAIDLSVMIRNGIEKCKNQQTDKKSVVTGKRRINLVRMNDIEEEAITWLWEGFLPKATLTLLGGAIQAGKSTIAMSLAATVTTGGLWPDKTRCNGPGNVIFWSSEEVVKSVVKPRLMAAGADTSRILTIESSVNERGELCAFDPTQDIPLLRQAIMQLGSISLVIIDPMISAVSGDTNKANDVRRSLQPVVDLAEEFDCTVLGIHHLAKNSEGKSTNDRMLGSQAFAAMARMVLVAAKDENSDNRVLAISKSNISKDNGGFNYAIEGFSFASPRGKEIKTSRIVWGETLQGSSRSILAGAEGDPSDDNSKLGIAKQFLRETLAHQAVGSRELLRNAREAHGISEKTLRRAKDSLGITPQHAPIFEGGWSWALPVGLSQP